MNTTRPVIHWANAVTALRLVLALSLWYLGPDSGWLLVGVATTAALLDVVDGPIARRAARTSAFGARFDMETDAFLILTLAVMVWRSGQTGPWVVASGLLRYLFIAAGWGLPWLRADLPPRVRRQAVCVMQVVALIVALPPVVPSTVAAPMAAAALAVLTWSFAADVAWLARARRQRTTPS